MEPIYFIVIEWDSRQFWNSPTRIKPTRQYMNFTLDVPGATMKAEVFKLGTWVTLIKHE